MHELEGGAIANPDEKRMVGHYWLRNPELAPNEALRDDIVETNERINRFASDIHVGRIAATDGRPFEHVLLIGIGGSALGPQFVADALGDDDLMRRLLFRQHRSRWIRSRASTQIGDRPGAHARRGDLEVGRDEGNAQRNAGSAGAFTRKRDSNFAKHAVAVTGVGSELDNTPEGRLAGAFSDVGLGGWANFGDERGGPGAGRVARTRHRRASCGAQPRWTSGPARRKRGKNPAMLLALMWYYAGNGRGEKDMVILPYKDRLALFASTCSNS